MAGKRNKKRSFVDKLKNKYRLVILNDETFEERASFRLSRFNVYVLFATQLAVVVLVILGVMIYTPLGEIVVAEGSINYRKMYYELEQEADSLRQVSTVNTAFANSILGVLRGDVDTSALEQPGGNSNQYDSIQLDNIPQEDLKLRQEMEKEENYSLFYSEEAGGKVSLNKLNFFPPLEGYVSHEFDKEAGHYAVDIVAEEKAPVKATLDGTVFLADWTLETGYVIGIQHDYNLVSFYKHNSALLKKVGNFVKAGEVIAIVGNTGELTTGPHLHFELWKDGVPVDPDEYVQL